ncbi:MAG: hypothetical protein QOF49_482, partial [Chloroflexota bacterium]|nr:hypothetical protein [Chloroflexota bacterium]
TVELEYGERDVRVHGRAATSLAGELEAAAAKWRETLDADAAEMAILSEPAATGGTATAPSAGG